MCNLVFSQAARWRLIKSSTDNVKQTRKNRKDETHIFRIDTFNILLLWATN